MAQQAQPDMSAPTAPLVQRDQSDPPAPLAAHQAQPAQPALLEPPAPLVQPAQVQPALPAPPAQMEIQALQALMGLMVPPGLLASVLLAPQVPLEPVLPAQLELQGPVQRARQVLAPQALQALPDQLVQELQALLGPQELALQVLPE